MTDRRRTTRCRSSPRPRRLRDAAPDPVAVEALRRQVGDARRARRARPGRPGRGRGRVLLRRRLRPHRHPRAAGRLDGHRPGTTRPRRSAGWPVSRRTFACSRMSSSSPSVTRCGPRRSFRRSTCSPAGASSSASARATSPRSTTCSPVTSPTAAATPTRPSPRLAVAFTDEFPTLPGPRWPVAGMGVAPRPVQQPRPPIWIGGSSKAAIRRTAALGDGWLPQGTPRKDLPGQIAELRRLRDELRGGAPLDIGYDRRADLPDRRRHRRRRRRGNCRRSCSRAVPNRSPSPCGSSPAWASTTFKSASWPAP